jgi:hypothetical protein
MLIVKQLSGHVLVKETNAGVGGAVVAAYDAKDLPRSSGDAKTAILEHLGRPLGSVVSDAQGRFEISIEARATEARPTLVVAVFAPEDATSLDDPRPQPAEKRLMFLTRDPRDDAAPQESFVIRLLQAQVDRHGLGPKPAPDARAARRPQAIDAMGAAWDEATAFRDRFKDQVTEQLAARLKRRKAAKQAVRNLSGIPLHLRDGETPNLLQDNSLLIAHRRDLAKRLPDLQQRVVSEGLKRLQRRKHKPVARLYLSPAEIKALGLSVDEKTGRISGEVPAEKFREKARAAIGGSAITKKPGPARKTLAALQARVQALEPAMPGRASPPGAKVAPTRTPSRRKTPARRPKTSIDKEG